MPYQFKNNPSNADKFTLNGVTYIYNSAKGVWKDISVGTPPPVTSSDTAPANPSAGDLWYRTDDSTLYVYYNDGSSSQWVGVSGPSGPAGANGADGTDGTDGSAQSYTNFAAFPSTGNTLGDLAVAQDTKALYMWDGTEWDRVALGNDESPVIVTEPPTTHTLSSSGNTSSITMTAQDPEGFGITYGVAYNTSDGSLPNQLSSATTIDQSNGVFTFTPTSNTSLGGEFKARLSASDGAKITTRLVDFTLSFGYSQIRWHITAKRGSDTHMQAAEFELRDVNGVISMSGKSVSATNNFNNTANLLIDGTTSKAEMQGTPSTGSPLIWTISGFTNVLPVSYRFRTGNDYANRDPWDWTLQGYDGTQWVILHTVTGGGGAVSTSRLTWTSLYTI